MTSIATAEPIISSLYDRIQCTRKQGEEKIAFTDLRNPLSQIEAKVTELLMKFAKAGADTTAAPTKFGPILMIDPDPVEPKSEQPYRYEGVKPPTLRKDDLHRSDNTEEEYPLTYHELKSKVWRETAPGQKRAPGWRRLSLAASSSNPNS